MSTFQAKPAIAARAAIYARVSTGPQEKGTSLESQLLACRARAEATGARVVGVHQDVQSGADLHSRKGMQAALQMIERGEADTLIVYDMSRYSRDAQHQQEIKKRVLKAGGSIEFCTMDFGDLSSADASLTFSLIGVVAAHERAKIVERTSNGSKARARAGVQPVRGKRPFGYTLVTRDVVIDSEFSRDDLGTYHIRPDEAEVVKHIFDSYLQGQSLYAIASDLAEKGIKSPTGNELWRPARIKYLLQNPLYRGTATYGRHKFERNENGTEGGGKATMVKSIRDKTEWILIPAPAIVSDADWEEVQRKLVFNRNHSGGQRHYLLSGMLRCPRCGAAMCGNTIGDPNKKIYRRYRCRVAAVKLPFDPPCDGSHYHANILEDLVKQQLLEYVASPELVRSYYEKKQLAQNPKDLKVNQKKRKLEARLAELSRSHETVLNSHMKSVAQGGSATLYEAKLVEIDREYLAVEKELSSLELIKPVDPRATTKQSARVNQILKKVLDVLDSPEIDVVEKRRLLTLIIDKIHVSDKTGRSLDYKIELVFRSAAG